MTADSGWMLDLIDDELEIPGWLIVPVASRAEEKESWIRGVLPYVRDITPWDGEALTDLTTREVLSAALELRERSDSMAILQIWPTLANATAMCHIDVMQSDPTLDWTKSDAAVHPVDEPHIGPGLQISTNRTVSLDDVEMDVSSTTFAFDNGEVTLLLSLTETLTPLVTLSLPGLVALMRNVRLLRTTDGEVFSSIQPVGVLADEDWDLEGTA